MGRLGRSATVPLSLSLVTPLVLLLAGALATPLRGAEHASVEQWGTFELALNGPEAKYEGDIDRRWGRLSGEELVLRLWNGLVSGSYVGHGEIFRNRPDPWLAGGGELRGRSVERLAFVKADPTLTRRPRCPPRTARSARAPALQSPGFSPFGSYRRVQTGSVSAASSRS